jgi:hypothetical protein
MKPNKRGKNKDIKLAISVHPSLVMRTEKILIERTKFDFKETLFFSNAMAASIRL